MLLGGVFLATVLASSALAAAPTGGLATAVNTPGPQSLSVCRCSPASLLISLASAATTLSKGDRVNVTYEFEVSNYTAKDAGLLVHIPVATANFPLRAGGYWIEVLWQRNLSIAGAGWSSPSLATGSKVVTGATLFSGSSTALLTTQKIAVMADAPHDAFHLNFRWEWSIYYASNGTTLHSAWSAIGTHFHYQATILPAPLVWRRPTQNTLSLGSLFIAPLVGRVANQPHFLIEMEYPGSGDVVAWVHEQGPSGSATHFNITLYMMSSEDTIPPGDMLVHIHDGYGDIIYSITVHLFTPVNATVKFVTQPGSCGPITFNGTSHANSTTGRYATGQSYAVSAPSSCGSLTLHNWTQVGGGVTIHPVTNGTRLVSVQYNATLIATYA